MIPHLSLDALSWTCLFYGIGYAVVYLLGKISRKPKPPPGNAPGIEDKIQEKEAALNAASLTYSESKAIGPDASDSWTAHLAMFGFYDPRILGGYGFEAEAAFAHFFA